MPCSLREVVPADIETFYAHQLDHEANRVAGFVAEDPSDLDAFRSRWARLLDDPTVTVRTVLEETRIAGYVASFLRQGTREVSYWLGREFWGRGIGTSALRDFLAVVPERPLFARAAKDNRGSLRVLEKCGFRVVREETFFAAARGKEIPELVHELPR